MIDIVVVNYKGYNITKNCINSILNNTIDEEYTLYIVDNSHNKFEFEKLKNTYNKSNVIFIQNLSENTSFCYAVNIILKYTNNDVIIMNNDIIIEDNLWIKKLKDTLYANKKTGMVELSNDKVIDKTKRQPFGIYIPFEIKINSKDRISSTCVIIKNECLKMVGLMDEINFSKSSGDSDVDYCLRLKLCGYEVDVAWAKFTHLQSVDTKREFGENNIPLMIQQTKQNFNNKWKHLGIYKI